MRFLIFFILFPICIKAEEVRQPIKIEIPPILSEAVDKKESESEKIELSISSWEPEGFRLKSRRGVELNHEMRVPEIKVNYLGTPIQIANLLDASVLIGASYAAIESEVRQRVHFVMGELGVQMTPRLFHEGPVSLFGRFAFRPMGLIAGPSEMANEVNEFSLPVEISTGLNIDFSDSFIPVPCGLLLGVSKTMDTFFKQHLSGYGFKFGLRFLI